MGPCVLLKPRGHGSFPVAQIPELVCVHHESHFKSAYQHHSGCPVSRNPMKEILCLPEGFSGTRIGSQDLAQSRRQEFQSCSGHLADLEGETWESGPLVVWLGSAMVGFSPLGGTNEIWKVGASCDQASCRTRSRHGVPNTVVLLALPSPMH